MCSSLSLSLSLSHTDELISLSAPTDVHSASDILEGEPWRKYEQHWIHEDLTGNQKQTVWAGCVSDYFWNRHQGSTS